MESINELAQIMKDLSVLVIDQGTILDRIDYNIQATAASIDEGVKQIEKANETQKKGCAWARRRREPVPRPTLHATRLPACDACAPSPLAGPLCEYQGCTSSLWSSPCSSSFCSS